jgi:hypothetical protein
MSDQAHRRGTERSDCIQQLAPTGCHTDAFHVVVVGCGSTAQSILLAEVGLVSL